MSEIIKKAEKYARKVHKETNHKYDGGDYIVHLEMVVDVANGFKHLLPEEERDMVIASCWTHDVIEDCRETYNDVVNSTNKDVAEITYALTNEKGKNRKERANDKYYQGIRDTEFADFVKICDRIANILYSKIKKSRMFLKYKDEYPEFREKLYNPKYGDMFIHISNILEDFE